MAGGMLDLPAGKPLPDGDPFTADRLGPDDITLSSTRPAPPGSQGRADHARDVAHQQREHDQLFHVTGCNSQLLVALGLGGAAVILPAFDQAALIASIPGERISFLVTVPAVYSLILRRPEFAAIDVSQVSWVAYGGAPTAPSLVRDRGGLRLLPGAGRRLASGSRLERLGRWLPRTAGVPHVGGC